MHITNIICTLKMELNFYNTIIVLWSIALYILSFRLSKIWIKVLKQYSEHPLISR